MKQQITETQARDRQRKHLSNMVRIYGNMHRRNKQMIDETIEFCRELHKQIQEERESGHVFLQNEEHLKKLIRKTYDQTQLANEYLEIRDNFKLQLDKYGK